MGWEEEVGKMSGNWAANWITSLYASKSRKKKQMAIKIIDLISIGPYEAK